MAIRCSALLFFLLVCAPQAHAWDAYVLRVVDSNTIAVSKKRNSTEGSLLLRFYGVEAPSGIQPFAPEARAYMERTLPRGTRVNVESVGEDSDGIVTALIQVRGSSLNYQIVAEGLAWVNRSTCKALFCRRWHIQEHQAVVEKRGLWSVPMGTPPWQWGRK